MTPAFALNSPPDQGVAFVDTRFDERFDNHFGARFNPPDTDADFDRLVSSLHQVAAAIDAGHADALADADRMLRRLLAQLQDHADPRCTGLMVFASALAQRLASPAFDVANLYLRRFEVPQIELFNLLGRHVPMADLATRVANDAMARAIAGQPHPTLIDVGIGTGRQISVLMHSLAAAGRLPQRLTVVGIEPSAVALEAARTALTAEAEHFGVRFAFFGFARSAEALCDADWQAIAAACSAAPVVNAAFALHHIADDAMGLEQRSAVLRRLRALQPQCLVLSEPDVDHIEPRFLPRFGHCFRHFSAVFGVLDALALSQAQRDALKVGFFGREIADILGTPEAQRSERHETAAAWLQRLGATGFRVRRPFGELPVGAHPAASAAVQGQRVVIRAGDEPVVSIFVATPAPQAV